MTSYRSKGAGATVSAAKNTTRLASRLLRNRRIMATSSGCYAGLRFRSRRGSRGLCTGEHQSQQRRLLATTANLRGPSLRAIPKAHPVPQPLTPPGTGSDKLPASTDTRDSCTQDTATARSDTTSAPSNPQRSPCLDPASNHLSSPEIRAPRRDTQLLSRAMGCMATIS